MWLDDSKRTRSIKASVVERWLIISRYRLQAPFHSWFLFCQDVKFRERAQKSIVEVRGCDLNTEFQFETAIHTRSQNPACVIYVSFISGHVRALEENSTEVRSGPIVETENS